VPELAVGVEVLHLRLDHVRGLDAVAGLERALDDATGLEVAHLDAVESLALAGLHHLVLDDRIRVVLEDDLEAGLEFVRGEAAHLAPWTDKSYRVVPQRGADHSRYLPCSPAKTAVGVTEDRGREC
jgi:hypothetical protein